MPNSSRDFQRAARQRLSTAAFLLEHDYTLDAVYLSGYVIECSLKALILAVTPEKERADILKQITAGSRGHDREILSGLLKDKDPGIRIPVEIVCGFRRFPWTTSLRYETGRKRTGEARGYLKAAERVYNWVEGKLS